MTAKEYLMKLEKLSVIINQKLDEVNALRQLMTSVSAVDTSKERVTGGRIKTDANFVNALAKIEKLEKEVTEEISIFFEERHRIINEIQSLQNAKYVSILYKRYVEFKSLGNIAKEMNFSYDRTRHLHGYALVEFEKNFLKVDTKKHTKALLNVL